MKKEKTDLEKILIEYEKNNEEIVDRLLKNNLSTREAIRELNKNLGGTLVELSNLKNK